MIIFINGCFGVGKSTVAQLLLTKIDNSMLYDPEEVGFMLRNILKPIDPKNNFQDYPAWRLLVPSIAALLRTEYDKTLIIPMCIWEENYLRDIKNALKNIDTDFHHFCLVAPVDTVKDRLHTRDDNAWAMNNVEAIVAAHQSDVFADIINTASLSAEEVVAIILKQVATGH